jgi:hypothetical protein
MTDALTTKEKERYNKVREALKTISRQDMNAKLLEMGFEYVEEERDDTEKYEENNATPVNKRQEVIVKYFEHKCDLSPDVIQNFLIEIENEEPNYPLLRKYFKQGGTHIVKLLQDSLVLYPRRESLLNALAYFSVYNNNIFSNLIKAYNFACKTELDLKLFKEIVKSFYMNVSAYNYDVFLSLKELCKDNKQKLNILIEVEKDFAEEIDVKTKF